MDGQAVGAGRNMHYQGQHGAEDPADTAARLALVRELDTLRAEVARMRDELRWYGAGAHSVSCNVLAGDTKAMLSNLEMFALDGGKRAAAFCSVA